MASSVPPISINANGVVVPPQVGTGSILTGVLNDLNTAFGGNLNTVNLSSPQGQLASSLAAYINDKNTMFAYFVSQVDPQYSEGFMQDAIGRLFGLSRLPATYTEVVCQCSGAVGTVIPANAQAQDQSGNLYITLLGGTILAGGVADITFQSLNPGPVPCPVGTLTRIMTTTPGWDSITNAEGTDTNPLTLGRDVESPQAFEVRRQDSLYINAQSMSAAIAAAVLASGASIPNIPDDCYVYDNATDATVYYRGVGLPPHSVYVAVQGGDPDSIANAIWSKKAVGCGYAPSAMFLADTASSTTLTVTAVTAGTIQVGQTVMGTGIPDGTTISALGTGTGGLGTYTLSAAATATASDVDMTSVTEVMVEDTAFFAPAPTYPVRYTVPKEVPVYVNVSVVSSTHVPSNALGLIQDAVVAAFLGEDGGQKARIGATVYSARFYAPILAALPGVMVSNITVGFSASPTTSSITPDVDEFPFTNSTYITMTLV